MRLELHHMNGINEVEITDRLEQYLKRNKFQYVRGGFEEMILSYDEFIIWVPNLKDGFEEWKRQNRRKLENLARYLFVTLKLSKRCLHFPYYQFVVNGVGQDEEIFTSPFSCVHTLRRVSL